MFVNKETTYLLTYLLTSLLTTVASSGQIVGERGETAFPFSFLAGERRSPSFHDDSY